MSSSKIQACKRYLYIVYMFMDIEAGRFLDFLSIKRGLSRSTVLGHKSRFKIFKVWLEENNLTLQKSSVDIFMSEKSKTVQSVNEYIYFFKSLELYLEDIGKPQELLRGYKIRKIERPPVEILSIEEVNKLITTKLTFKNNNSLFEQTEYTYRILTEFLYLTACRIGEASSIQVKYIDLENNWVTFTHTKGKKFRRVPIGEPLITHLKPFLKKSPEDLVFTNKMNKKINPQDYWTNLQKRAKFVGITRKVYPHILRHSSASHMAQAGQPIQVISQILGHSDLSTTVNNYIAFQDEQLKEVIQTLPFYKEKTDPQDIIKQIIKTVKNFQLQDNPKLKFTLLQGNNFVDFKVYSLESRIPHHQEAHMVSLK